MIALFDYYRYRDDDGDNSIWTSTIPVYRDDTEPPNCSNPTGATEILGFADVKVIAPNPPPSTNLQVQVDCNFKVIEARSGGANFGNILGSIPGLVE